MTDNVLLAHPQVNGISKTYICLTEEEQAQASQGELPPEAMMRKEEDYADKEHTKVYTKNFFIGLDIEKKPSEFRVVGLTDSGRGWPAASATEPVLR